jgi:hypothetical protein
MPKIEFKSTSERDDFLNRNFPERKCEDTPGCYSIPNGHLSVNWLSVEYAVKPELTPEFRRIISELLDVDGVVAVLEAVVETMKELEDPFEMPTARSWTASISYSTELPELGMHVDFQFE